MSEKIKEVSINNYTTFSCDIGFIINHLLQLVPIESNITVYVKEKDIHGQEFLKDYFSVRKDQTPYSYISYNSEMYSFLMSFYDQAKEVV